MDPLFWFNVLTRWIHVTSAALLVGGLVYVGLVLLPALRAGGETGGPPSGAPAIVNGARFRMLMHAAMGLLLLTGIYNFVVVLPRVGSLGDAKSLYHGIIGTKILLALVLFGAASVLLSRRAAGEGSAPGEARPLPILIALGLVVLFLSAILRRLWDLAIVVQ